MLFTINGMSSVIGIHNRYNRSLFSLCSNQSLIFFIVLRFDSQSECLLILFFIFSKTWSSVLDPFAPIGCDFKKLFTWMKRKIMLFKFKICVPSWRKTPWTSYERLMYTYFKFFVQGVVSSSIWAPVICLSLAKKLNVQDARKSICWCT